MARMGERRGTYRVLVGKPEIYHLEFVGRDRRIIKKIDFKEIG